MVCVGYVKNTLPHNDTETPNKVSELYSNKDLKSSGEMAAQLALSKRTFLSYVRKGLVRGFKLSARSYRFHPDQVLADLAKLST